MELTDLGSLPRFVFPTQAPPFRTRDGAVDEGRFQHWCRDGTLKRFLHALA